MSASPSALEKTEALLELLGQVIEVRDSFALLAARVALSHDGLPDDEAVAEGLSLRGRLADLTSRAVSQMADFPLEDLHATLPDGLLRLVIREMGERDEWEEFLP